MKYEMTDKEFKELQDTIQRHMMVLNWLQKIHRQQTGRDFVISRPIVEKFLEDEAKGS